MVEERAFQFYLKEFEALREEIIKHIDEIQNIEIQTVVGSFLIYTWIVKSSFNKTSKMIALWLPVLLSISSIARSQRQSSLISDIGEYIFDIEDKLGIGGWQHFLQQSSWLWVYRSWEQQPLYLVIFNFIYNWRGTAFLLFTIAVAFIGPKFLHSEQANSTEERGRENAD